MHGSPNKLYQFWQELKRRRVVHVIVVYATAAFVILELVNNVFEPLYLPEWTPTLVILILAIGFPLAVIFSWIFDVTPEGIEKTKPSKEAKKSDNTAIPNSWRIATYVSVIVIIGLLAFNIFKGRNRTKIDESLERSIAVLPFYYYNMDPDAEDIGDAFANEIITQLYKIKSFDRIISHTSTLQYKGSDKPPMSTIGMELDVNYIIEGSLERQSEEVSIQIQIIHAASDDHLWAEEFKGEWNDIFTIRANIAKNVAEELKTILTREEIVQIEKRTTNDLKAYDYYLLGNQYRSKFIEEALYKAVDFYESAIYLDPGFAQAYVGLAKSYRGLWLRANWLPDDAFHQAKKSVSKALDINDKLAEAHEVLAQIKFEYEWDLEAAERDLLKALDINPNMAYSYAILGDIYLVSGHYDKSHQSLKQAVKLDPNSSSIYSFFGRSYYWVGQVDSAINYLQNRIMIAPDLIYPHFSLGLVYLELGDYSQAIREFENVIRRDSITQHYRVFLGIAFARAGMLEETRNQLKYLNAMEEESRSVSFGRAALLAELGEIDAAIHWLQKAYEERNQWVFYIKPYKVLFSSVRSDPRFIEICNKIYANIE